jgi:hypothetical protein
VAPATTPADTTPAAEELPATAAPANEASVAATPAAEEAPASEAAEETPAAAPTVTEEAPAAAEPAKETSAAAMPAAEEVPAAASPAKEAPVAATTAAEEASAAAAPARDANATATPAAATVPAKQEAKGQCPKEPRDSKNVKEAPAAATPAAEGPPAAAARLAREATTAATPAVEEAPAGTAPAKEAPAAATPSDKVKGEAMPQTADGFEREPREPFIDTGTGWKWWCNPATQQSCWSPPAGCNLESPGNLRPLLSAPGDPTTSPVRLPPGNQTTMERWLKPDGSGKGNCPKGGKSDKGGIAEPLVDEAEVAPSADPVGTVEATTTAIEESFASYLQQMKGKLEAAISDWDRPAEPGGWGLGVGGWGLGVGNAPTVTGRARHHNSRERLVL